MKMNFRAAAALAAVMAVSQLAGCGRYEAIDTGTAKEASKEPGGAAGEGVEVNNATDSANTDGAVENGGGQPAADGTALQPDGAQQSDSALRSDAAPQPDAAPQSDTALKSGIALQPDAGQQQSGGTAAAGDAALPADSASGDDEMFRMNTGMGKEEASAFVGRFLDAVQAGDQSAVAAMITYPRMVKTPSYEGPVAGAEEFLTHYDEIFTEEFKQRLKDVSPSDVFYRNGLISVGDGSLWFYPATAEADMSVGTINAAQDRYVRYDGPQGVQPG